MKISFISKRKGLIKEGWEYGRGSGTIIEVFGRRSVLPKILLLLEKVQTGYPCGGDEFGQEA